MKFKKTEEQQAPCVRQSPLRETLYKVAGGLPRIHQKPRICFTCQAALPPIRDGSVK